jgi:predicted RNA-binding Zn-ribbon protein involved in translation (DUF1610 family)
MGNSLLNISDEDITEFFKNYYCAFMNFPDFERAVCKSWSDLGFRVSFDKDLQPFVGETLGYNRPDQRGPISTSKLLTRIVYTIEKYMKDNPAPIPGGRFFFSKEGISKKDRSDNIIVIAKWNLEIRPAIKDKIDDVIKDLRHIVRLKREISTNKQLTQYSEIAAHPCPACGKIIQKRAHTCKFCYHKVSKI